MDIFQFIENLSKNPTISIVVGTFLGGILLLMASKYIYRKIKMPKITIEGEEAIKKHYESLNNSTPPIPQKEYLKINNTLAKLLKEKQTDEIIKREAALTIGKDAAKMALEGKTEKAKERFQQAVDTYPEVEVINLYGILLMRIGELDDAISRFKAVIKIGERFNNKETLAGGYGNLGLIYEIRGDLDKAEEFQEKALTLNKELGNKEGMAANYGNLGNIYQIRENLDKAGEFHKKALDINKKLGNKEGIAVNYGDLGIIFAKKGDLDKAEEYFRKSLDIAKERGDKEVSANQYGNLGNIYATKGDLDKAEEMFSNSFKLHKELGSKEGMAFDKWNISLIKEKQNKLPEALELTKEARELYEQVGIKHKVEEADKGIARLQKLIDEQ